ENRNENFYKLLYMVIVMTMIDTRTSCPHMFNIPRDERNNKNGYIHSGIFDDFESSDDITVLVKIFSIMMSESMDNNTKYVNYRKWCKKTHINSKFIEMAQRLFNQVWYIVFDSENIHTDDFITIAKNAEFYSNEMENMISSVYYDRVFTLYQ